MPLQNENNEKGLNWFPCPECRSDELYDEIEEEWFLSWSPLVLYRQLVTVHCPDCEYQETFVWKLYGPYFERLTAFLAPSDSNE